MDDGRLVGGVRPELCVTGAVGMVEVHAGRLRVCPYCLPSSSARLAAIASVACSSMLF
jgi:hypothetical protein